MLECMHLLRIFPKNITAEFCKALLGIKVYDTFREFRDIILFLIPETEAMVGFVQYNEHHIYDVYEHSLKSVELIEKDTVLRVTMFFHDIGKPLCFSMDNNRIGHFYGHADISAQITKKVLRRMRFSNRDTQDIVQLIKYHNRQIARTRKSINRLLREIGDRLEDY